MRTILALLLVWGCGRIDFDPRDDAAVTHTIDVPVDATSGPALCHIPFGEWVLDAPVSLDEINTMLIAQFPANGDQDEFDPVFSDDGLSLYFTSDQSGSFQVWVATRPSLTAPFDTVSLMAADVNAATNSQFGFQPLASLGIAMISAPYAGAIGSADLWRGSNSTGPWIWSPTILSTIDGDGDARMTADGLSVYFVRGVGVEDRDIYSATRTSLAADFDPPALVAELNTVTSDASPVPVSGGIFVVSDRAGGAGADDLYYSERTAMGLQPPYPLTALDTDAFDGEPAMFDRGGDCELLFVSTRAGAFNLYRSRVARP